MKMIKLIINILTQVILALARMLARAKCRHLYKVSSLLCKSVGVDISTPVFIDNGFKVLHPRNLHIARNVSLGHDNHFWCFGHVYIDEYTQTAKDLLIISGSHNTGNFAPLDMDSQIVKVGKGCWIGARVTILGGTSIGYGSIIAAGSVVKGTFEPFSIIAGVPARAIKKREASNMIVSPFGEYCVDDIIE